MNPASTTRPGAKRVDQRRQALVIGRAVRKPRSATAHAVHAGAARPFEPGGRRVADDGARCRRQRRRLGPRSRAPQVAAAPGNQHDHGEPAPHAAMRHASDHDPRPPLRTSPTSSRLLAGGAQHRPARCVRIGRGHAEHHAEPQLKVRYISASRDAARRAAASRRPPAASSCRMSTRASGASGSTRGMFSVRPPPVMWARACTGTCAEQRQHGLDVDARGREQRVAQRLAVQHASPASAPLTSRPCGSANSRWSAGRTRRARSSRRRRAIRVPSMILSFSTTPTQKPARS